MNTSTTQPPQGSPRPTTSNEANLSHGCITAANERRSRSHGERFANRRTPVVLTVIRKLFHGKCTRCWCTQVYGYAYLQDNGKRCRAKVQRGFGAETKGLTDGELAANEEERRRCNRRALTCRNGRWCVRVCTRACIRTTRVDKDRGRGRGECGGLAKVRG